MSGDFKDELIKKLSLRNMKLEKEAFKPKTTYRLLKEMAELQNSRREFQLLSRRLEKENTELKRELCRRFNPAYMVAVCKAITGG